MPGFTVNRDYPYSLPSDPADVAGATQALAEAVDADVQALRATVAPRPMARVRGFTPVVHDGAASTFGELYFELIDFNVGGAIAPLTTGRVKVLLPGRWMVVSTFSYMRPAGADVVAIGANLMEEQANVEISRANTHLFPTGSEILRNMDLSGMTSVTPGLVDGLWLRSEVRRAAGGTSVTFMERTMTLLRMTES